MQIRSGETSEPQNRPNERPGSGARRAFRVLSEAPAVVVEIGSHARKLVGRTHSASGAGHPASPAGQIEPGGGGTNATDAVPTLARWTAQRQSWRWKWQDGREAGIVMQMQDSDRGERTNACVSSDVRSMSMRQGGRALGTAFGKQRSFITRRCQFQMGRLRRHSRSQTGTGRLPNDGLTPSRPVPQPKFISAICSPAPATPAPGQPALVTEPSCPCRPSSPPSVHTSPRPSLPVAALPP